MTPDPLDELREDISFCAACYETGSPPARCAAALERVLTLLDETESAPPRFDYEYRLIEPSVTAAALRDALTGEPPHA